MTWYLTSRRIAAIWCWILHTAYQVLRFLLQSLQVAYLLLSRPLPQFHSPLRELLQSHPQLQDQFVARPTQSFLVIGVPKSGKQIA